MRRPALLDSDADLMNNPELWQYGDLFVVRDDLLQGGTKRRALNIWLPELGKGNYVYAGPCEGYAQLALAYACRDLGEGYQAWLVLAERQKFHPRTQRACDLGALIVEIRPGYLSVVQSHARHFAHHEGFTLLPFGLDNPRLLEILASIARGVPYNPKEVWCVAGSGTLTRALQQAWPRAKHFAVQVGHTPDVGRAELLVAPEAFAKDALDLPPFPSCGNYDAKAWQFIVKHASPGALFWNVAADPLDNDVLLVASSPQERKVPSNGNSVNRKVQGQRGNGRGTPGRRKAEVESPKLDSRQRQARPQGRR